MYPVAFDGSLVMEDIEVSGSGFSDINVQTNSSDPVLAPIMEFIEISDVRFVGGVEAGLRISTQGPAGGMFKLPLLSLTDVLMDDDSNGYLDISLDGGAERVMLHRISSFSDTYDNRITASGFAPDRFIDELTISNSAFSTEFSTALSLGGLLTTGTHVIEYSYFCAENDSSTLLALDSPATVTAINNWWGGTRGPDHTSNPDAFNGFVRDGDNGGQGAVVFAPWLDTITTSVQLNPVRTGERNQVTFQITNSTMDAFLPADLGSSYADPLFTLDMPVGGVFVNEAGDSLGTNIPASIEGTAGSITATVVTDEETTVLLALFDRCTDIAGFEFQSLGIPELSAVPPVLDFGPQDVDTKPTSFLQTTLRNTGTSLLTITGEITITGADADEFFLTPLIPDAGTTIPIGEGFNARITYDPSTVGDHMAALVVPTDDPNSPLVVTLMGSGNNEGISTKVVYVDGTGDCNGDAPCYPTIQEGVSHAAPAPAAVHIYPGIYDEHVNLGLMGSEVGGSQGVIDLISLNADGEPEPGTVILTNETDLLPEADKEPGLQTAGFGPLIFSTRALNGDAGFLMEPPDDVRIDGLALRAFQTEGIDLGLYRSLTIENVDLVARGPRGNRRPNAIGRLHDPQYADPGHERRSGNLRRKPLRGRPDH